MAFYQGDVKRFETSAYAIVAAAGAKVIPVELTVPLAERTPGTYDCQVVVLDLEGKKVVSFWRAAIAIVP